MDWQDQLNRIQIVLVEPQDGANIGSVCRAMKTMGITNLVIVGEREYNENRVRTMALHARDVWEKAVRYPTLQEALERSVLTVAMTRRRGKFRKAAAYSPRQLAQRINTTAEGAVSLVFGRESDGLTDDEVALCSMVTTITTSDDFPSLNLSQAVQIITYELFNSLKPYVTENTPVDQGRCEIAARLCSDALQSIEYFKLDHEGIWTYRFLKDVLVRASLTEGEVQRFEKIFTKMSRIKKHKEATDV
jgi:tRNA/rRNA methyltransferase